jgi:hypothetical protein
LALALKIAEIPCLDIFFFFGELFKRFALAKIYGAKKGMAKTNFHSKNLVLK